MKLIVKMLQQLSLLATQSPPTPPPIKIPLKISTFSFASSKTGQDLSFTFKKGEEEGWPFCKRLYKHGGKANLVDNTTRLLLQASITQFDADATFLILLAVYFGSDGAVVCGTTLAL